MRYRFTARSAEGETKTGFLEATDPTDASRQLERRKLQLIQLDAEKSEAPSYVRQQAAPVAPLPVAAAAPLLKKPAPPSLWKQLDRGKLLAGLAVAAVSLMGFSWLSSRLMGPKTYRLHLVGHLSLVSKKELESDYMDRVQLGVRLENPGWQIDRDGTIEEKNANGRYHPNGRKARVKFQVGAEGDYTLDVEVPLPKAPASATFFVEAPGFPARQQVAQLAPSSDGKSLEAKVAPLSVKQLKKRETRSASQATPDAPAATQLPKYDADAPEPAE